jgi:hypothetical protein
MLVLAMFRIVANAVFLTALALVVIALVKRVPVIRSFRDCYFKGYAILNEKHTITRSSYVTQDHICLEHKKILVEAAQCEHDVTREVSLTPKEWVILNNLGHLAAFGTKNMAELIASHNQQCPGYTQKVQFDERSQTWF